MDTAEYYDRYWNPEAHAAEGWTPSEGVITREEKRLFDAWITRGAVCLDYGCGDGARYGRALRERGVDYRGFDISAAAVERARTLGLRAAVFRSGGVTDLPAGSADVAVCFEVLEHLQEPQAALAEIRRCLRPGGRALLSVPNAAFWTQRLEFLLTGFWCPGGSPVTARREPWRDPHIRFFHPRMLARLARESGLEPVQELGEAFTLGATPFLWRRRKLRRFADGVSRPLGWLGRVFPSWFAARLFLVVEKPLSGD